MIRAVMICDYKNPISVAYSKIALKTWEPVKNVKVERFQCYTPDTINDAPFKINFPSAKVDLKPNSRLSK